MPGNGHFAGLGIGFTLRETAKFWSYVRLQMLASVCLPLKISPPLEKIESVGHLSWRCATSGERVSPSSVQTKPGTTWSIVWLQRVIPACALMPVTFQRHHSAGTLIAVCT